MLTAKELGARSDSYDFTIKALKDIEYHIEQCAMYFGRRSYSIEVDEDYKERDWMRISHPLVQAKLKALGYTLTVQTSVKKRLFTSDKKKNYIHNKLVNMSDLF